MQRSKVTKINEPNFQSNIRNICDEKKTKTRKQMQAQKFLKNEVAKI